MNMCEDFPDALLPYCDIEMNESRIVLYSGAFSLKSNNWSIDLEGIISYSLCGKIRLMFEGHGVGSKHPALSLESNCQICTRNGVTGDCFINSYNTNNSSTVIVRGVIETLFSDQIECGRWHWSYLNMKRFLGSTVMRVKDGKRSFSTDRLSFCCKDGTQIILENSDNQNCANNITPYRISHHCKLIPAGGNSIGFETAYRYISAFTNFISFVVGRYHSAILIAGENTEGTLLPYYYSGYDFSQTSVTSWLPFPEDRDIESLWPRFEEIWNGADADKADILSTAVHWYLEANMGSGKVEGAIVMARTGLQLMWNVILTEEELKGKEHLQILLKRMNYNPPFDPACINETRDRLIHYYDVNRRKQYQQLTFEEKYQSLENSLNILELAILYWLGYNGHYADRTCSDLWQGASTKSVPWAEQN